MEASGNCTKVIGTTQEAGQYTNSVINGVYEGYISRLVVSLYLVMPHVRHACVLLPLIRPHVKHAGLGLHIVVSLKGRTRI